MLAQGENRLLRQERVAVVLKRMIHLAKLIFLFGADEQLRWRNTREFVEKGLSILQFG